MSPDYVFPQDRPDGQAGLARSGGMTLRDYFAAQALSAIANVSFGALDADDAAVRAYAFADSMLWARELTEDDAE